MGQFYGSEAVYGDEQCSMHHRCETWRVLAEVAPTTEEKRESEGSTGENRGATVSLRRVQHCGNEQPHEPHVGRWRWHDGGPYCDGTNELLARQREREADPPPGPP